jgi:hypothetical protein
MDSVKSWYVYIALLALGFIILLIYNSKSTCKIYKLILLITIIFQPYLITKIILNYNMDYISILIIVLLALIVIILGIFALIKSINLS